MAENKKRTRKAKLELRDCADNIVTEKTILQTTSHLRQHPQPVHPQSEPVVTLPPSFLDHTYARPNPHPTPSSSALQLSVKVEVEEFDESFINENSPDSERRQKTDLPPNYQKLKSILVFEVNLDKIYKVSDHINWSSLNIADKYLSTEIKNIWGRVLRPEDDDCPYNLSIQGALHSWGYTSVHGRDSKESPLFYQCHICKLCWWYLAPFRDHIRTHNHEKLKVYHLENGHESYIVASDNVSHHVLYIPCKGNCYRCGNPYKYHVKLSNVLYYCKGCHETFETCSMIGPHESVCPLSNKRMAHLCVLCSSSFHTSKQLEAHMVMSHQVRSDVVIPFSFKTCNICQKKYQYYNTHMCVKSSLSSSCVYCYRKFHTKTLQTVHYYTVQGNSTCKICDLVLPARCMMTEHMLTHTNNYRMVYKCINITCPSTLLFPDEMSIKMHKVLYHKQKFDKRRTYYEKVVIPEQCVKYGYIQVLNSSGDSQGITIRKVSDSSEPVDWNVSSFGRRNVSETQTSNQTQDDDVIIIKQELQEMEIIEIDSHDDSQDVRDISQNDSQDIRQDDSQDASQDFSQDDSQDISQDDSQDRQMDYAEMLSKVFKVSDAVRTPPRDSSENIRTQIKVEPSDADFEDMIDIHENLITIKQEPIEACLGRSFGDICQTDSRQNGNSRNDSYQNSTSLIDVRQISNLNESIRSDRSQNNNLINSCQSDTIQGVTIKTEPQDYEMEAVFDNDITAVNIEAGDIKRETLECAEVNEYTGGNVVTANEIFDTFQKPVKRGAKKDQKHSIKTHIIIEPPPIPHFNSFSDKNVTKDVVNAKQTDTKQIAEPSSKKKPIKKKPRKCCPNRKSRTVKYNEYGKRIKKTYKCARCGFTADHKMFKLHQTSFCEAAPEDKDTNFVCTKCDCCFGSLKTYLVHFTKHGYQLLHCPCCNVKFEALKDMIPHFHKHVKLMYVNCWMINDEIEMTKKQHRCQTCRQIVEPKDFFPHWEDHLKLKVDTSEPTPLPVTAEDEPAPNNKELLPAKLHMALHQLRSTSREKDCLLCCRKFTRRYDVKRHLIEHLLLDAYTKKDNTPTLMLRCQICLEEFHRAEQYKFHMREHGSLPVYRCDLCDKTFSDSSNFAKHKKIHNMRVLICDICQKKFQAKSSLEKHIIMHMTTEPIKCELCDRKFYATSHYNKHLNVRHMRPTRFKCVVCDVTFTSLRQKWDHAWAVHKERKQKADCPVCNKKFRKYIDVKNHAKAEHQLELSFYNIKSDSGVMNNVNMFCKVNKSKKKRAIVAADHEDSD